MWLRLAGLIAGGSCVTAIALAVPTPLTPAPGAATGSLPTFTWTLPPNEQPQELDIADKPDRTATGRFVDRNIVQFALFGDTETEWRAVDRLYAGHYWWLVGSSDPSTQQGYWSPLRDFRVRVVLRCFRSRSDATALCTASESRSAGEPTSMA
jgi:hypothetical protein